MPLPPDELGRAAEALSTAQRVVLVCHVNPDADAMGSMLGLAGVLAKRGTTVAASFPNGLGEGPRWLEALPGREHLVEPRDIPKDAQVLVTLDAAHPDRLGGLGHLLQKVPVSICIDHHRTNDGFGTINLVDHEASSTAEVVFRLVERMGDEVDANVAACLYAGLVTDTGRFQFEATTPEVLRLAAHLREQPFDHSGLSQALYEDSSLPYLRLLGRLLERIQHVPEADLVWTYVTRKDLDEGKVPIQETDDLIDIVRTAREADVAAVIKEQREGGFKVSMRSRGKTDVAAVSAAQGGGGHRLAAGYASKTGLEDTVRTLVQALTAVRS
ncbi:MAG TPA: bifunctional oligoribonuclease/PAP phosphatase NrnA [Actinomycetota bacterium]|nr:bifunctional oligoribonuclease/PAP phosphatase NrnA [Actinomycetota bacterium]